MSAAAHTPGPWELGAGDDYYVSADAYPKNFPHGFKSDDLGDYLAYVGNRTHDFGEANARLIAAAPDLLAALHELHLLMDFEEDVTPDKPMVFGDPSLINQAMKNAYAALAKVKDRT